MINQTGIRLQKSLACNRQNREKNTILLTYPKDSTTFGNSVSTKAQRVSEILPKAKISQQQLDTAFSDPKLAKDVLDNDWHTAWKNAMQQKPPVPTTGFCYPATEFWYHFVDNKTQPMTIKEDSQITDPKTGKSRKETHYFLQKENGNIIDPTKSQYGNEEPKYHKAQRFGFLTEFPSQKACKIAVKLRVITEEYAKMIPQIFRGKKFQHLSLNEKLQLLKSLKP